MYCPRCGTQVKTSGARFCYECGADVSGTQTQEEQAREEQRRDRRDWRAWTHASYGGRASWPIVPSWTQGGLPTLLGAAGVLTLLLLAIPILAVVAVIAMIAGVALVATLLKLAPIILVGLLIYWTLSGRHRHGRHGRQAPGSGW